MEALDTLATSAAFEGSALLDRGSAGALFNCLPFGTAGAGIHEAALAPPLPPDTRCIAALEGAALSVGALQSAYAAAGGGDPSVLLLRTRSGHVLGGYAEEAWRADDLYYGTPRSFLFSVSRDAKVPFHGRVRGPRQANDDELRAAHEQSNLQAEAEFQALLEQARELSGGAEPEFDEAGRLLLSQVDAGTGRVWVTPIPVPRPKPYARHDALRGAPGVMAWGVGDLVLRGDCSACSSALEHSYGIGLSGEEAGSLLAGAADFAVVRAELWVLGLKR